MSKIQPFSHFFEIWDRKARRATVNPEGLVKVQEPNMMGDPTEKQLDPSLGMTASRGEAAELASLLRALDFDGSPKLDPTALNNSPILRAMLSKTNIKTKVQELLSHGADPNKPHGIPLSAAVMSGDTDVVRMLLKNGADPQGDPSYRSGQRSNMPLKLAMQYGNGDIILLLIMSGARATTVNLGDLSDILIGMSRELGSNRKSNDEGYNYTASMQDVIKATKNYFGDSEAKQVEDSFKASGHYRTGEHDRIATRKQARKSGREEVVAQELRDRLKGK